MGGNETRQRLKWLALWPAAAAMMLGCGQLQYGVPVGTSAPSRPTPVESAARAAELARRGAPLPRPLKPSLDKLWGDVARPPPGCFAAKPADRTHQVCTLGDPRASRTIVLLGDSHLGMWMDPIVRAATARGYKVVPFVKGSCFPADVTLWRSDERRVYTECDSFRRWAYAEIAELKPDRIIISGAINVPLSDAAAGKPIPAAQSRDLFAIAAETTLRELRKLAPTVHAISGTPVLRHDAGDCLAARKATRATCAVAPGGLVAERNALWRKAAAASGAYWVDVTSWLCDRRTCPLVIGDVIVFRDSNHLTRTFADLVGPDLVRRLGL